MNAGVYTNSNNPLRTTLGWQPSISTSNMNKPWRLSAGRKALEVTRNTFDPSASGMQLNAVTVVLMTSQI